jgi:hypothetical protein
MSKKLQRSLEQTKNAVTVREVFDEGNVAVFVQKLACCFPLFFLVFQLIHKYSLEEHIIFLHWFFFASPTTIGGKFKQSLFLFLFLLLFPQPIHSEFKLF